ncbi:zinc ABC transporter ATP-binding protein ZnuC [Gilvimarinus agarilyticus]|uniref:zinc ABC transporter ATP-binding protein ZnuC n=1 Tax=unclassified Gilvimarinus TaxID=2642066 RepID=UPI001C0A0C89|nr:MULTISPECIES: zinc ABC transporter ATP-binding protein ZnuC [unclassified Gilvimarinus]MBU2884308.1 zinc ABC transporter ATP-binding protein ZnuC [Gilvimarinus agarilyticus]MDO6569447.1 zinc ABC transporter ATP-binding protein ZnuC [Gilvimarinus sp. 2_MG-2023]MDO6747604.1 zinc ABC transporter ATP-binding protein ZnuC [Gilvimarinus sp. 1_MG-2023]
MAEAVNTLVKTDQLSVVRGGKTLIDNASVVVEAGKIVTLIGPNGAGKTTLVRALLGLTQPTSGELYRRPKLRIGYMPQKLHLDPSLPMTVQRFLTLTGRKATEVRHSLERTGAPHLLGQPMQALSGGETQRVLLARALLQKPELLVLDEPVQGVDVAGQAALYALINDIRTELNCGVLLISHDLHLVMATTDTVVCLNGHVCCHGHPEQVTSHPAYLELFGHKAEAQVALYTHHHDHAHDDCAELDQDHSHHA